MYCFLIGLRLFIMINQYMREEDAKNKVMVDLWSPKETDVDQTTVFQWINGILNHILWSRYQYWAKHFNLGQNRESIELGCGYGKFSLLLGLVGVKTTLLDYNASILENASKLHSRIGLRPHVINKDLLQCEQNLKNTFDIACSFGTLEHFSGLNRLLAFQAHVYYLKPGGLLFISVPNRNAIFYRIAMTLRRMFGLFPKDFFEQPFSINELNKIASQSNVRPLEIGSVSTLKEDFNYRIITNVKSLYRKIFHIEKKETALTSQTHCLEELDFSKAVPDNRTYLDKMFSYSLIFVGVKE